MRDSDRKLYVAGLADKYVKRQIGRPISCARRASWASASAPSALA